MIEKVRVSLLSLFGVGVLMVGSTVYAQGVLQVAHDKAFPPFIYVEDGKTTGLAADLLNAAAKKANVTIQYQPLPFAQLQEAVNTTADAVFPIAINAERKKVYDFSLPVLKTGGAFFVLKPQPTPVEKAELEGKKITTPKTGPLANYLEKNYPASTVLVTANYDESLKQLVDKEVDVAALNLQVGSALAEQKHPSLIQLPEILFLELPLALAVKKGAHEALLSRLNAGLEEIRQDGTAEKINSVWMSKEQQ